MTKVYISLPIGGFEKTVRQRYEKAKQDILAKVPDAIISGPLNIDDFDDDGYHYHCPTENLNEIGRDHPWEYYIGEDIKELLTCDAIYMTKGWAWSRGCKVEYAVSKAMNFHIMMADDAQHKLENNE